MSLILFLCTHKFHKTITHRHTGDTGYQPDDFYEPRHRYSLSDMITHIKRSIPDLRAIKHQPLENKESPCGSPKHGGGGGGGENVGGGGVASTSGIGKSIAIRSQIPYGLDGLGCCEKDADAVTLSAIQTTSCTCGPNKIAADHVTLAAQIDKTSGDLDDEDAMLSSSGGHHHHYHYHPSYQQSQQHQQLPHHHHHHQHQQPQHQHQQLLQQQPPLHQSTGHEVR